MTNVLMGSRVSSRLIKHLSHCVLVSHEDKTLEITCASLASVSLALFFCATSLKPQIEELCAVMQLNHKVHDLELDHPGQKPPKL